MPRFSNRPFLATTLSFLSSRGAADSLRRVGREMTKLVPSAAAKGAPGLAFETWDPSNQFPLETPILLFVIRSEADLQFPGTLPGNAEYYPQTELSSRLPRRAVGPDPDFLPRSVGHCRVCCFR